MVFFTCNACGESLKKAQVDKHVNMCRGCQVLSCIDCGKDFWGDDYKDHVRCISEDQKYGGKGYEAKSNKGDVKQQQWIQKIHDAMNKPGITPKLKDVLQQVSSYDNVPRKKAKFQNWMKNSLKIHNPSLHDQVWDIFSAATSNTPETPKHTTVEEVKVEEVKVEEVTREVVGAEVNGGRTKLSKRERKEARRQNNGNIQRRPSDDSADTQEQQNGKKESKKERKRKRRQEEEEEQNGHVDQSETTTTAVKKRKKSIESDKVKAIEEQMMDQTTDETGEDAASKGKFNWKGTIKALLRQSPEEGLSVKKLRKKVLAAYYSFSGENNFKTEADLLAILNKKINSNPKFRVLKDKVRLVK